MMVDNLPSWKELQPHVEAVIADASGPLQAGQVRELVAVRASLTAEAVASKFPSGASRYEDRISDALRDLVKNGTIERIKQGWFQSTNQTKPAETPSPAQTRVPILEDDEDEDLSIDGPDNFADPSPTFAKRQNTIQLRDGAPGDPVETRWWHLDSRLRQEYEQAYAGQELYDEQVARAIRTHLEIGEALDAAVLQWGHDFAAAEGDPTFLRMPSLGSGRLFPHSYGSQVGFRKIGNHIDWVPGQFVDGLMVEELPGPLPMSDAERLELQRKMADELVSLVNTFAPVNRTGIRQDQIDLFAATGAEDAKESLDNREWAFRNVSSYEKRVMDALNSVSLPSTVSGTGRFTVDLGLVVGDPSRWPLGVKLLRDGRPVHILLDSRRRAISFPAGGAQRFIAAAFWGMGAKALEPVASGYWNAADLDEQFFDEERPNPFIPAVRKALAEFR